MRIAVHMHDQLDIYTVDIIPLGCEEVLEVLYTFIYIETQPIDNNSEQSKSSKVPCFLSKLLKGNTFFVLTSSRE